MACIIFLQIPLTAINSLDDLPRDRYVILARCVRFLLTVLGDGLSDAFFCCIRGSVEVHRWSSVRSGESGGLQWGAENP
jgi:hypothetical protein